MPFILLAPLVLLTLTSVHRRQPTQNPLPQAVLHHSQSVFFLSGTAGKKVHNSIQKFISDRNRKIRKNGHICVYTQLRSLIVVHGLQPHKCCTRFRYESACCARIYVETVSNLDIIVLTNKPLVLNVASPEIIGVFHHHRRHCYLCACVCVCAQV